MFWVISEKFKNSKNSKKFMFKNIKKWAKTRHIQAQIEKMRLKTELMKYKTIHQANIIRRKTTAMNGALRELEAAENLKNQVASTLEANTLIQILNNETIQQLIKAATFKLIGGQSISANDDELIQMYKQLPADIKTKVKKFAFEYVGAK